MHHMKFDGEVAAGCGFFRCAYGRAALCKPLPKLKIRMPTITQPPQIFSWHFDLFLTAQASSLIYSQNAGRKNSLLTSLLVTAFTGKEGDLCKIWVVDDVSVSGSPSASSSPPRGTSASR